MRADNVKHSILRAALCWGLASVASPLLAANQTATATPVIVGGDLPYSVELRRYDVGSTQMPGLHSFMAGEHGGHWVVLGGLTNGLHGFDLDQSTLSESKQNREVWVIDPVSRQTWSRTLDPTDAGSGLTEDQVLSVTPANAQFEQVGNTLYTVGGYGDDNPADETSRNTFANLSAFDLPGLIDWAKGGAGQAADHFRQVSDPLFKVTGGDLYGIDGQMHLVFGQDYQGRYRGNLNGEYTKQVRTFTIQDDGAGSGDAGLGFTHVASTTPEDHFRRRDLNIYPTLQKQGDGILAEGITVLSGVFTETRGAWTVPVEIDANGNPTQVDGGLDPLNTGGELDADDSVFKQAMNNYHSAKLGLFSEATGDMHELLFGGITLQEYDPTNPAADVNGFVTDGNLPNTSQISGVVRRADGSYEQHYLGAYPELYTDADELMRFGSNAEFFLDEAIAAYDNGVIPLDLLYGSADEAGEVRLGYIYGGLITNAAHVFGNPVGASAASGEIFEVVLRLAVPEPTAIGLASLTLMAGAWSRRRDR